MVLQPQLFAADRYKEQLDENKHIKNTFLLPLFPASLSITGTLPIFFKVKLSSIGNYSRVLLIQEVEEINITPHTLFCMAVLKSADK